MIPRVSVCVPNLNTLPFLKERFETIFSQTFQDWELFVYDSHSDDGSWEYLQELASKEPRMRLVQGPRAGPYPAWNECVRQTRGEYIYIATSDDTMAPDCLEKMVGALDRNPSCDLSHCPLRIIDYVGRILENSKWPDGTVFGYGIGDLVGQSHVRKAPYDGLLHLTGRHVYLSITQLLIRRPIFSRIGDFQSTWGSISDFNWEMKAGLVADVIHVSDTWASWRKHPKQLTASVKIFSANRDEQIEDMINDALITCQPHLSPSVAIGLNDWRDSSRIMRAYYAKLRRQPNMVFRRLFQIMECIRGNPAVRSEIIGRLLLKTKWTERVPVEIRNWLQSLGIEPVKRQ